MVTLSLPASRSPIKSADIRNLSGFVLGTAGYGQQFKAHRLNLSTDYANTFGQVDTSNGYIAKFQYGDPDGAPTTVLTVGKAGVAFSSFNRFAASVPLQELTANADGGLALQVDNNYEVLGITAGTVALTGELGSPTVNIQKIARPDQAGTVDGDRLPAGGFGGPLYLGYTRRGENLLATTAVVSATAKTVTCAGATFTSGMVGGVMDVVSGTGSTAAAGTYQPRRVVSVSANGATATLDYTWYVTPDNTSSIVVNRGNAIGSQALWIHAYDDSTADIGTAILHQHLGAQIYATQSNTSTAAIWGGLFSATNASHFGFATALELDLLNTSGYDAPAYSTPAGAAQVNRILQLSSTGGKLNQVGIHFTSDGAPSALRNGLVFAAASVADNCINFAPLVGGGTTPTRLRDGSAFTFTAKSLSNVDVTWLAWAANALVLSSAANGVSITAEGDFVPFTGALANLTDPAPFVFIGTCAGNPSGTPATHTGRAAMVLDTSTGTGRLYVRVGNTWRYAALT